jgi:hypothetical protein
MSELHEETLQERPMEYKSDLIKLIARRDGCTIDEAAETVEECQQEIDSLLESGAEPYELYDMAQDAIQNTLGLEPDYMQIFIDF